MENTVSIRTAKAITEESHDCILTTIPGKKIMFEGKKKNGETIALCTPYSKFNINNRYWVDITEVQLNLQSLLRSHIRELSTPVPY